MQKSAEINCKHGKLHLLYCIFIYLHIHYTHTSLSITLYKSAWRGKVFKTMLPHKEPKVKAGVSVAPVIIRGTTESCYHTDHESLYKLWNYKDLIRKRRIKEINSRIAIMYSQTYMWVHVCVCVYARVCGCVDLFTVFLTYNTGRDRKGKLLIWKEGSLNRWNLHSFCEVLLN